MWRTLFFLAFISEANAKFTNVAAEVSEEQKNAAIGTRMDEPERDTTKGSLMSGSQEEREPTQGLSPILGEEEKTSSPFSGRNETSSAPGAILRTFDTKYLEEKVSFPVTEAPWWERWWFSVKEWWAHEVTQ